MEESKREKAIEAISKDPNRIIKTNPIINARFDITTVQMKVFLKIIASIDQSKDDISEVQISVGELQKFVGRTSKNIHKYLQEELVKLKQRNIFYEDENIRLDTNLLSSIIYYKKQGYFSFEIPKALKPFLLQIKENFTVFDIRNMLFLESIYAMRLYEYCKEFERFKHFEIDVEEIKERFGIADRYKNYFDFKLKVINQARTELMKNSELYFDFDEIKEGKKVVRLRFTIIKNNKEVTKDTIETLKEVDEKVLEIIDLVKMYVSESTVNAWFEKYPYEQIKKGVIYSLNQAKNGGIKDVGAYLQKMVATTDLFDPSEIIKQEQKKKREQEKAALVQKEQELTIENAKNKLKAEYYDAKKDLSVRILAKEIGLSEVILAQLKIENEQEYKPFLSEMALKNYKSNEKFEVESLDEFLFNVDEGGSFASYVFDYLQNKYGNAYQKLRQEFLPKASRVGVKGEELV